jgi:hypothetical protein
MRLERSALGNPHSRDHFIVIAAIALFASTHNIDLEGHVSCTYRKTDCAEAQPDVSFYWGRFGDGGFRRSVSAESANESWQGECLVVVSVSALSIGNMPAEDASSGQFCCVCR